MRVIEFEADTGAFLRHLTSAQRQRLNALGAAYTELPLRDVEALAEAVVTLYDDIAESTPGHENGA